MKKLLISLSLLIIGMCFYSCEEDFCSEDTTPNIIIDFYDNTDSTTVKEIELIISESISKDTIFNDTFSASGDLQLPLDTQGTTVVYHLSKQDDLSDIGSVEDLTINYTTEDVFVSRECGFKSIFNNLNITTTSNDWLLGSETTTNSITNETEVHVKIYH